MATRGKSRRAAASAATPKVSAKTASGRSSAAGRGLLAMDSERSARLLLIGAVSLIVLIAAGFIAFGYWYSVIKPRNRTVLRVDDTTVSYAAMKRRMGYEYFQNLTYQRSPQLLPEATYQTLLNELTEINHASDLKVTADAGEIDKKLRNRIGTSDQADQREFSDALRRALDTAGLSEGEYRRVVQAEVLVTKLKERFTGEVPPTVIQAKVQVIAAATQDEAQKAIDRINFGEDFAAVAGEVSQESDAKTTGGVHDYGPKGSFTPAYDDYVFSTNEIGKPSAPLASNAATPTFFVVKVIDRSEQPVKDDQKAGIANGKFDEWLSNTQDDLTAKGKIRRDWDTRAQTDALVSVIGVAGPKLQKQQLKQQQDQQKADQVRQTTVAELTANPRPTGQPPDTTPGAGAATVDPGTSGTPVPPSQPIAPGGNGP